MYTAVQPLWNCCKKISKIRTTRRLLSHLDFTKFNFGQGSAMDPARGLWHSPRTPSQLDRRIPVPIPHALKPSESLSRRLQTQKMTPKPIFWIHSCLASSFLHPALDSWWKGCSLTSIPHSEVTKEMQFLLKVKAKVRFLYSAVYTITGPAQFTISELAADRQELMHGAAA